MFPFGKPDIEAYFLDAATPQRLLVQPSSKMFEIVQNELNMKPHSVVAIETKKPSRIPFLILLSKLIFYSLLIMPNAARAQWPDHVIRLIVPYGVGSNMDTVARLIAAKLGEQLQQSVIVENRVGGTTIIGTNAIAKSAPDGYTLGLANTTSQTVSAAFTPNLPFDPIKDFSPIATIGTSPFVLLGTAQNRVKTLKDFIALAKANPGQVRYASAGVATLTHLAGELVARKTGIKLVHVPYRGAEQSMVDLAAGRIELMVGTIAPTLGYIRAGKLRALAIMDEAPSSLLPDVPTISEAGAPGCEAVQWIALVAPAGVPKAIVMRLNQDIATIIKGREIQNSFKVMGITPAFGSPEDLAARIQADVLKWKEAAVSISGTK